MTYNQDGEKRDEPEYERSNRCARFIKLKGKIKEKVGQATDNPILEGEGKVEELVGQIQTKLGQIEKVFEN